MKHPSLGLLRLPEPMADQSVLGRLEELLDLSFGEFLVESWLFLRAEVSRLPMPACFSLQLDMAVIQWIEHLAEDVEKLTIAGLVRDLGSVGVILLSPVDISQLKKWIPVMECLP